MVSRALNLKPIHSNYFYDVYGNFEYEISAAYEAGIIRGISQRKFAPHRAITREQMAVILHRAYNLLHKTDYQTFITAPYKDHRQIHFKKEVNGIYELGIMTGTHEGAFRPKKNSTRAQAAKVVWLLVAGVHCGDGG
ncbi:S-layer homology domain-containing protein [Jeotgalibacillus salarius]|uniref:S-layer homology domain-containing protein n=2 Tax=Jeotgalibacillus salarius TaxID=546023 RepID=A0A4Y8LLX4_9BACL|nr:S-layer homology domain-containing protein [Jeotgalibacillus salarius]